MCEGQYTAVTTDSLFSSTTSFITIQDGTTGKLTSSLTDDSCTTNVNQFCEITVSNFDHQNSDHFTYLLYKDNNLYETYQGSTGQEVHIFSNLRHGNYTLTAYDGNSASYMSQKTELCTCLDGYTLNSSEVYGEVVNTFTGLSANDIVTEWRRYNLFNRYFVNFATTWGPHNLPPFNSNPNAIVFDSGVNNDGTVRVDDPYVWLYTGETSTRKTENTVDWYLGTYNLPMEDGDDVGPSGYNAQSDIGVFYYNTSINKFVYRNRAISNNSWYTINSTANRGQNVYPITTVGEFGQLLTGSTAYDSISVPGGPFVGYTVTGTTNDVVQWNTLASGTDAVEIDVNSNLPLFLASTCKYLNYVHEVSLGSTDNDDDTIGLVLATFIDTNGLYGPKGIPHQITFNFNNASLFGDNVTVNYNAHGNSAYTFSDKNRRTIDCGYNTIMGCTTTNGVTPITGISSTIISNNYDKSPFSAGDYNLQGTVHVRVERSGLLGENFNIKITDVMRNTDVGTQKPYNSDYEIDFNILDKSTWVGNNRKAAYYAEEKDLYKFLGSQSIGYFQGSQENSVFYNISFTGTQSNYNFTSLLFGGSDSINFELGNADLDGVDMSTSQALNFYNSLGAGGEVGNPTVPKVTPVPTVLMQTTQIPIMETTGGTKISASTEDYIIYSEIEVEPGKEEPCVEFNFTWTKNTTDLLNGNMVPYYSLHPYVPEERAFSKGASMTRIFDNPQGRKTITTNNNQVIGEGLESSDCIKLSESWSGVRILN